MKVSNKRKILVFNFGDMMDGSMLMSIDESRRFANLRIAMGKRDIRYNCADAQYMMEDIYCVIRQDENMTADLIKIQICAIIKCKIKAILEVKERNDFNLI